MTTIENKPSDAPERKSETILHKIINKAMCSQISTEHSDS